MNLQKKNSIEFAKELNAFKFSESLFLASFDVKLLFANIPLDENTDICVNEYNRLNFITFNLTRKPFKPLLEISVKSPLFLFFLILCYTKRQME